MKRKILAAVLTACMAFYVNMPVFADGPDPVNERTVTIISANVLTTGKCDLVYESEGETYDRGQMLKDLLDEHEADSAGLCEVTSKWNARLDSLCSDEWNYAVAGRRSCSGQVLTSGSNEYSPILYRTDLYELVEDGGWWFSDTPDEKSKFSVKGYANMKYERVLSYAVLKSKETGEIAYIHMNAHYDHKSDDEINVMCSELLAQKARWLKDRFGDVPFVVTGDHNCKEETKAYKYLADPGNGFEDAKYMSEDRDEIPTCAGFLDDYFPEKSPRKMIDHIFVSSGNVEVISSRVAVNKYFSDHSAILSVMLFNDNGSSIGPYAVSETVDEVAKNEPEDEVQNVQVNTEPAGEDDKHVQDDEALKSANAHEDINLLWLVAGGAVLLAAGLIIAHNSKK